MPAAGNKKVRPLQGGIQIEGRPGPGKLATGTLGLVIDKEPSGAQRAHFVTAGHVVGQPNNNDAVGQPDVSNLVGRVEENHLSAGVDIAVVRTVAGVPAEVGWVWTGDGTHITVTFAKTGLPTKGSTVELQGAVSGHLTGTVIEPDADITDVTTGEKALHVVLVDYGNHPTAPGDSGAPVLSAMSNGASCYGVHGGSTVVNGNHYGWFTPFDNIAW